MSDEGTVPFGSNEVRLSPREWLAAAAVIAVVLALAPILWERVERFEPGPDYRVPFRLGSDYWHYSRTCRAAAARGRTLVVGDSVVWGHYVAAEDTLSHHLNELAGKERFANLGVDGIHPAALAGLIEHYGGAITDRDVVLHCNLLWMSSKRHDLQSRKEFAFNHPKLVPQLLVRIPCYRESDAGRLAIVVGRHLPFRGWASHLEIAYFDSLGLASWTLEHPYDNPLRRVTLELPSPNEAPSPEPVAEPWTAKGMPRFDAAWVELETSFQWRSLRRAITTLRRRGNRVFVLLGPFNEHMLTEKSLAAYEARKSSIGEWLRENGVPHAIPSPLPSDLYADASHPLGEGYAEVARQLDRDEAFGRFIAQRPDEEKLR